MTGVPTSLIGSQPTTPISGTSYILSEEGSTNCYGVIAVRHTFTPNKTYCLLNKPPTLCMLIKHEVYLPVLLRSNIWIFGILFIDPVIMSRSIFPRICDSSISAWCLILPRDNWVNLTCLLQQIGHNKMYHFLLLSWIREPIVFSCFVYLAIILIYLATTDDISVS